MICSDIEEYLENYEKELGYMPKKENKIIARLLTVLLFSFNNSFRYVYDIMEIVI